MKNVFRLTVFLVLVSLMFFVGGNQAIMDVSASEASQKVILRMAGQYAPDHSTTVLQYKFKEIVEAESKGEIEIKIYPANQLGDYTQVYEELRRGTIELGTISVPSQFDQRLDITYLHYLAMNYKEAEKIYARGSEMFKIMEELHGALGVKFLGFNVEGFGILGLAKKPDDLKDPTKPKNILLRVPPMAVFKITADDQGFQTISVPFAELYTALQTGVADGWSGGPAMVNYLQFGDVIKYALMCNNFFENTSYLMSMEVWNNLSEKHQKILADASAKISKESLIVSEENDKIYPAKLTEKGIEVIYFNDEELKVWADHCRKVTWPKLEERLTKEFIDRLLLDY